jgi:uridine kinase
MSQEQRTRLTDPFESGRGEARISELLGAGLWKHLTDEFKSFALEAMSQCRSLVGENVVQASGLEVSISLTLSDLWQIYLPLALNCLDISDPGRRLIGIIGPSGGGKTVFAEVLCKVINQIAAGNPAVTLGMDGYHFPNEYLDTQTTADGDPLRLHKGKPCSFDVERFISAIQELRTEDNLSLPEYDRGLHEPVEDRIKLTEAHKVILIEGNFLLHDEGGWERIRPLLNCSVYLDVDTAICRERLKARHLRGGRSEADTDAHIRRVDEPNHILVGKGLPLADLVLKQEGINVEWRVRGTLQ